MKTDSWIQQKKLHLKECITARILGKKKKKYIRDWYQLVNKKKMFAQIRIKSER